MWKVAVLLMVVLGGVVALTSIYRASVEGMMGKLGLEGADFGNEIELQNLKGDYLRAASVLRCGIGGRVAGGIKHALTRDEQQGELAFILGKERILCGMAMLVTDEAPEGTYEIVKGLGYLRQGYEFVIERAAVDSRVCEGMPGEELERMHEDLLQGTRGRVAEIVGGEWERTAVSGARARSLCPKE